MNTRNAWSMYRNYTENESKESKDIPALKDKISTVMPKSNTKKHTHRQIIRKNKRTTKTKTKRNFTENISIEPKVKKLQGNTKMHNVIPIFRINTKKTWTQTNKNCTEDESLDTPISKEKTSSMKSKTSTKRIHNEIPIFRINTRNAWAKQYVNYLENSSRLYENSRNDNLKRELLNVLHIAGSRKRRAQAEHENPACGNYNTNNSSGIAYIVIHFDCTVVWIFSNKLFFSGLNYYY